MWDNVSLFGAQVFRDYGQAKGDMAAHGLAWQCEDLHRAGLLLICRAVRCGAGCISVFAAARIACKCFAPYECMPTVFCHVYTVLCSRTPSH